MKKIMIAIPSLTGMIPIHLVQRILVFEREEDWHVDFIFTKRVLIENARNAIAQDTLNQGFDYLFFLDDDTIPPKDIIKRMIELDKDIVVAPVADRNGEGRIALFDDNVDPILLINETKQIGAGGMSCTLIKASVLKAVAEKYGAPFKFEERKIGEMTHTTGEDINFCLRAKELGFETWVIHDLAVWHIGNNLAFGYDHDSGEILTTLF